MSRGAKAAARAAGKLHMRRLQAHGPAGSDLAPRIPPNTSTQERAHEPSMGRACRPAGCCSLALRAAAHLCICKLRLRGLPHHTVFNDCRCQLEAHLPRRTSQGGASQHKLHALSFSQ